MKETRFEQAGGFLMIHAQCGQPRNELNCSHVALNAERAAVIDSALARSTQEGEDVRRH